MIRARIVALALAAACAAPACAQDSVLDQARETLRKMRELRTQRDVERQQLPPEKFGHLLKKPVIVIDDLKKHEAEIRPELKGLSGTIKMGGRLRVVAGGATYGVGDEILKGYRVLAITPKKLTIRKDDKEYAAQFDYDIP